MNKETLIKARKINFEELEKEKYKIIKRNAVEVDVNNSFAHELAKFVSVWLIRHGVLPEYLQDIFAKDFITHFGNFAIDVWQSFVKTVDSVVDNFGLKYDADWKRPEIVTEARLKNGRRADIFVLDTGEIVEIETNKKVKKEGAITIYI